MHVAVASEAARRANEVPVSYVVFDVLHLDGHDLTALPLSDRRRLLGQVLEPAPRWRPRWSAVSVPGFGWAGTSRWGWAG